MRYYGEDCHPPFLGFSPFNESFSFRAPQGHGHNKHLFVFHLSFSGALYPPTPPPPPPISHLPSSNFGNEFEKGIQDRSVTGFNYILFIFLKKNILFK